MAYLYYKIIGWECIEVEYIPNSYLESIIPETEEQLNPYENDGQATIELYKSKFDAKPIWTNTPEKSESKTKYYFLELELQDGMREHTHKLLFETKAKNPEFAILRFITSYWGQGEWDKQDKVCWFDGEFTIFNWKFVEIPNHEIETLKKYMPVLSN